MAGTLRLEIRNEGIAELLVSPEVKALIKRKAEAVAAKAAGETDMPILVEDRTGKRARYRVFVDDVEAKRVEAKTRLLGRAIDAARSA